MQDGLPIRPTLFLAGVISGNHESMPVFTTRIASWENKLDSREDPTTTRSFSEGSAMFIVSGEYNAEKKRGCVADRCAVCGEVAVLEVSQIYRKSHVYFIPLGSGKLLGTVVICTNCGGKTASEGSAFTRLVTEEQAKTMLLSEVLERTNPRLGESVAYRSRLEREARDQRSTVPGAPDPRLALAFARLAELSAAGSPCSELQARLSFSGTLSSTARDHLLREVDTVIAREQRSRASLAFVRRMSEQFKPEVDGCLGFLVLLTVTTAGTILACFLHGWAIAAGILAAVVAAVVLSARTHRALRRRVHKIFFRSVFLLEAQKRGVAPEDAVAQLRAIGSSGEPLDPGLRGLIGAIPLLIEVRCENPQPGEVPAVGLLPRRERL